MPKDYQKILSKNYCNKHKNLQDRSYRKSKKSSLKSKNKFGFFFNNPSQQSQKTSPSKLKIKSLSGLIPSYRSSQKLSFHTKADKSKNTTSQGAFKVNILKLILFPINLPSYILAFFINLVDKGLNREWVVKISFIISFMGLIFHFANMQVEGFDLLFRDGSLNTQTQASALYEVIPAKRGQIYISDLASKNDKIPLTNTTYSYKIWYDPFFLKQLLSENTFGIEEVSNDISNALNLDYQKVRQSLTKSTLSPSPSKYKVLIAEADNRQRKAIQYLRSSTYNKDSKLKHKQFANWINSETQEKRSYPENSLASGVLGFVQKSPVKAKEAEKIPGCDKLVDQDKQKNLDFDYYTVGRYGVEQKYCWLLGGKNGKLDYTGSGENNLAVENGADIHLTIDKNIQAKSEEVLQRAIKNSTNEQGSARHGGVLVMNPQTGKILAMASYPSYNPNNYSEEFANNAQAFQNVVTGINYEVGSVMKPLTVAAALNEYYSGKTDEEGNKMGVPENWTYNGYGPGGKKFQERNGHIKTVKNADGNYFKGQGPIDLKRIIRDSINTGIAEILDKHFPENSRFQNYVQEKFLFGKPFLVDLPGDNPSNLKNLETDLYCEFCYANFGYGQGFTSSMLSLGRAFTPIANEGKLVEPYLVEKIVYPDKVVDYGNTPTSPISRPAPIQVLNPKATNLVKEYMTAVVEEGFLNRPSRAKLDKYIIAGKTGTAQVARLIDDKYCAYVCTSQKGLFDHTYVAFGSTSQPEILIIFKLSEPLPGQQANYAGGTISPYIGEIMEYSLEYMRVPKNR